MPRRRTLRSCGWLAVILLTQPESQVRAADSTSFSLSIAPTQIAFCDVGWTQQLLVSSHNAAGRATDHTTTTARYQSSEPSVATVSSSGLVTARSPGAATIRVRVEDRNERVRVVVDRRAPPVRFASDVLPILTKSGCNSGGCHGKATGQNGFKLSLLGFDPHLDHEVLTRSGRGRRISKAAPHRSLMLLKATGHLPHGGGRRLDEQGEDYRVLENWIAAGAPAPDARDPTVQQITVRPDRRVLRPNSRQQLLVTATLSSGATRDVTRRSVFQSNEPELAEVNDTGLVTATSRGGLFTVMARFGGKFATFHAAVPFTDSPMPPLQVEAYDSLVDRHLVAQWNRLSIRPSPEIDDAAFLRRAMIDICGTLPTVDEVHDYQQDNRPDKRARLIDRLLDRPEYAAYFALKWADILQNRGRGYSTSKQRAGTALFTNWIRDSIATNKPYDLFVAEILTATGSQREKAPTVWFRTLRTNTEYVEAVAQAFLGVRVQCAQCHHHPQERWSQDDYYGLAAVFARVGRKGGFADAEVPTEEIIFVKPSGEVLHPRTGQAMPPKPLGGPAFTVSRFGDPRQNLAQWMAQPDNPYLARTIVNRMWGHFFGRGIIHPIDDARSTNPPTNPELLQALSDDFIASGYDLKHLIRQLCNSRAYRLSASPLPANRNDTQSFSRFYPRRLTAEVLLDGISQVLDVPTQFPGGPGQFPNKTRAIELPDENVTSSFLDIFGRPDRNSACECERTVAPALGQALELVNSREIQRKLTAEHGYVARLAKNEKSHIDNVTEIFLRTLSREPRAGELATAVEFLEAEPKRDEAYRSLLWSLLATNEFLFNH